MINLDDVQNSMEAMKREELLSQHSYKIWQGKDDKWRTYLPDEEKGRKLIVRTTQKDIKDILYSYYKDKKEKEEPITFDVMYYKWRFYQDKLVSDNTTKKYDTDYIRYFENTEFASNLINELTEEDIKVFIRGKVGELSLCKKACKTLFGYINNVFRSAMINRLLKENPMEYLEAKQFYKYCTEKTRPISKTIVSKQDMDKLYGQFREDYKNKPSYIPTYAVELATLTGMRVGELSALTWDSITDDYIIINKSEKYNRKSKQYYIDTTKNGKERIFPITKEIKELLDRVKKVEMQYGYICEWVFANENGRVHAPVISSCSKNKCRQVGITEKGIHAYRRTVNSQLRCDGVSSTIAASLLGHTKEVNEQYYTFDITDIKSKAEYVSKVNAQMVANK